MKNYLTKIMNLPFETIVEKLISALIKEDFEVIADVDIKKFLKKKINTDYKNYKILGVFNPSFAYNALLLEDKIGMLLTYSIVVQEHEDHSVEVSFLEPLHTMTNVDNIKLKVLVFEMGERLKKILNNFQ